MQPMEPFFGILFLAFLAEGLTEYLARPVVEAIRARSQAPAAESPLWLRYVAAAVGIGLAMAYRADLLALAGFEAASPWVGYAITGILCGRGSNYLHDLVDRWLAVGGERA